MGIQTTTATSTATTTTATTLVRTTTTMSAGTTATTSVSSVTTTAAMTSTLVLTTTTTQVSPRYTKFGTGACRGISPTDNPQSWYKTASSFSGTEADCESLCTSTVGCKAIEYHPTRHCELWTTEPQATSGSGRYACKKPEAAPVEPEEYQAFGTGACRGKSPTDNPSSWYTRASRFSGSMADCEALCTSTAGCKAIEYLASGHCELWTSEPQATSGNGRYVCRKRGAPPGPRIGYEKFGTGACRGTSPTDNPKDWYKTAPSFSGTEADCESLCTSTAGCKAIEYRSSQHCELWTRELQATS